MPRAASRRIHSAAFAGRQRKIPGKQLTRGDGFVSVEKVTFPAKVAVEEPPEES
jgi:hypothetical protein